MFSRGRVLAGLLLCLLVAGCPKPRPKLPKHVVLLTIDTQRADRLGCYGYKRPLTPRIDELAKESVLFEHCAAQASWTSPSMVSMMSGCYVAEELFGIPADKETLAECFQKAGWTTAGFTCNDIIGTEQGFARGFGAWDQTQKPYGSNAPILEWLRAHKDERTFVWIHLNEVHDEEYAYRPRPEADWRKYRDVRDGFTPGRQKYYDELTAALKLVDGPASQQRIQEEDGAYDDDVRYEDKRIGEILSELKQLGIWEDTLFALGADHGEGLFTHEQYFSGTRKKAFDNGEPATLFNTLQMTHGSQVYKELIHVPLILRVPGLPAARVPGWVENVDLAPTLLELAGIQRREQHQGQSLLPLLQDADDSDALRPGVFTHSRYNDSVIDQQSCQLIQISDVGVCDFKLENQLYDLARDPESRNDLVGREPARAQALSQLAQRRLREGLKGGVGQISSQMVQILETMGYLGGTVESLGERFRPRPTDELLGHVPKLAGDCLGRREIAKVLEERTLTTEQKTAVRNWLAKEGSPAVRAILERLLAK